MKGNELRGASIGFDALQLLRQINPFAIPDPHNDRVTCAASGGVPRPGNICNNSSLHERLKPAVPSQTKYLMDDIEHVVFIVLDADGFLHYFPPS